MVFLPYISPTKVSCSHSSVMTLTLHEMQIEINIVQVSILSWIRGLNLNKKLTWYVTLNMEIMMTMG